MNKTQKNRALEVVAKLTEAHSILDELSAEIRSEFDEMTEKRQESEAGQNKEAEADTLNEIQDEVEQANDKLHDLIEGRG